MEWLNLPGLTVILALLAPNILFAARRPNTLNACRKRGLIIGEQMGRYGCMALMCLHTGLWEFGYAASGWAVVWLVFMPLLTFAYLLVWVFYFRRVSARAAMLLAALPAAMFVLSALLWRNLPLLAFSLLFTVTHTAVTACNIRAVD